MGPEFTAPLTVFGSIVAIVWIIQAYISKNRRAVLETIRMAIEKGQELTPETVRALGVPRRNRHGDLKWGVIWLAIAAACVVAGFIGAKVDYDDEHFWTMLGVAAFPGFVGLALLFFWLVTRGRDD